MLVQTLRASSQLPRKVSDRGDYRQRATTNSVCVSTVHELLDYEIESTGIPAERIIVGEITASIGYVPVVL